MPITIAYILLPAIAIMTYWSNSESDRVQVLIYAAQVFLPVCSLLWPMAYMQMWVDDECKETLISCNKKHRSCIGEVLILFTGYMVMLIPPFTVFCFFYGFMLLEYIRLGVQCLFVMMAFHSASQLMRNVTLGSLPIIAYLFLCICFSGSSDFQAVSILNSNEVVSFFDLLHSYGPYFILAIVLIIFERMCSKYFLPWVTSSK